MFDSEGLQLLLIDDDQLLAKAMQRQLALQGFRNHQHSSFSEIQCSFLHKTAPEQLIMSIDTINAAVLAQVKTIVELSRCPVIIFSAQPFEDENNIALTSSGASCYPLIDPLKVPIKPLLINSQSSFDAFKQLKQQLTAMKTQLADRKQIERAKGLLMKQHTCDEEQAYIAMRKLAMNRAQRMGDVARELIQALA